jgi:amino acid transporter
MAAWLPLPSGFTGYATRFVDPALGFCLGMVLWSFVWKLNTLTNFCIGWNYWFKVSLISWKYHAM